MSSSSSGGPSSPPSPRQPQQPAVWASPPKGATFAPLTAPLSQSSQHSSSSSKLTSSFRSLANALSFNKSPTLKAQEGRGSVSPPPPVAVAVAAPNPQSNNNNSNNNNNMRGNVSDSFTGNKPSPLLRSTSVHSGLGDTIVPEHPLSPKSPKTTAQHLLSPKGLGAIFGRKSSVPDLPSASNSASSSLSSVGESSSPMPIPSLSSGDSKNTNRTLSGSAPSSPVMLQGSRLRSPVLSGMSLSPKLKESITRKFSLPEESSQTEVACEQCELLRKAVGADDAFCSERCVKAANAKRRKDSSETNVISLINPEFQKIHSKARWNALDSIKDMINKGCPVDLADGVGNSPLGVACQNGHYDLAKFLLEHGAKVTHQNISGGYPLHFAVANDYEDIIKLLLDYKADTNARNYDGFTPEEWKIERKRSAARLPWNPANATSAATPTSLLSLPRGMSQSTSQESISSSTESQSGSELSVPHRRNSVSSSVESEGTLSTSFDSSHGDMFASTAMAVLKQHRQHQQRQHNTDFIVESEGGEISLAVPELELPPAAMSN